MRELVAVKRAKLYGLRPLAPGTISALDAWYDVELTYTSNALEGNTLTRSETAIVLEKGITVSGKPLKDHLEATGHRDALRYMKANWLWSIHHSGRQDIRKRSITTSLHHVSASLLLRHRLLQSVAATGLIICRTMLHSMPAPGSRQ